MISRKKLIRIIGLLILSLMLILLVSIMLAVLRFKTEENNTTYSKAVNADSTLVIIYRPDCSRCRRVLPVLYLKHSMSRKREFILNAKYLTPEQKSNLEESSTPTFRYKGKVWATDDENKIERIWRISH